MKPFMSLNVQYSTLCFMEFKRGGTERFWPWTGLAWEWGQTDHSNSNSFIIFLCVMCFLFTFTFSIK